MANGHTHTHTRGIHFSCHVPSWCTLHGMDFVYTMMCPYRVEYMLRTYATDTMHRASSQTEPYIINMDVRMDNARTIARLFM